MIKSKVDFYKKHLCHLSLPSQSTKLSGIFLIQSQATPHFTKFSCANIGHHFNIKRESSGRQI